MISKYRWLGWIVVLCLLLACNLPFLSSETPPAAPEGTATITPTEGLPASSAVPVGPTGAAAPVSALTPSPSAGTSTAPAATQTASAAETKTATFSASQQPLAPMAQPDSVGCEAISVETIRITWKDTSSGATDYRIERKGSGKNSWQPIGKVASKTQGGGGWLAYDDKPGFSLGSFEYRVRAYRAADGSFSDYRKSGACRLKAEEKPPEIPTLGIPTFELPKP